MLIQPPDLKSCVSKHGRHIQVWNKSGKPMSLTRNHLMSSHVGWIFSFSSNKIFFTNKWPSKSTLAKFFLKNSQICANIFKKQPGAQHLVHSLFLFLKLGTSFYCELTVLLSNLEVHVLQLLTQRLRGNGMTEPVENGNPGNSTKRCHPENPVVSNWEIIQKAS